MSGIYVHIPFCKQACVYCDFHFSTLKNNYGSMLKALVEEAKQRKDYLASPVVNTLYFGGGTPSILGVESIKWLVSELSAIFQISEEAEISLEANPDDLSEDYLKALASSPINRLSIGIQSFKEEDLRFMNRAHNAEESIRCLELLPKYGFSNYTIDLIYGLPRQSVEDWLWQLDFVKRFKVPHFSAYALTVEENTALHHQVKNAQVSLKDESAWEHFQVLQAFAEAENYNHYELSNFCKAGAESRHNTSYWQSKPYLGLGPSAHSFNGKSRTWNISNNTLYLKGVENRTAYGKTESLELNDRYNELVMTRLRLIGGLDLKVLEENYEAQYLDYCLQEAKKEIAKGRLILKDNHLKIPAEYRFQSDGIAASLFKI